MLTRADLNETSPVCLFPTPKETITEIKIRIGGGRKIEIFGSGGPTESYPAEWNSFVLRMPQQRRSRVYCK